MADGDGDGVADEMTPVGILGPAGDDGPSVFKQLPGAVVQIRSVGDVLAASIRQRGTSHIVILRDRVADEGHLELMGTLTLDYPDGHLHLTNGLALRPGTNASEVELYFNVGSRLNASHDPEPIATRGLIDTPLRPESIYRITLSDDGDQVTAADARLIAIGVRNGASMAFHPSTGDLYFQDNGIDLEDGSDGQLSADELDVIEQGRLGVEVLDFGFPDAYADASTGARVGLGGEDPIVTFEPIADSESEGAAEITFAPSSFPDGLTGGILVGFHGRRVLGGVANEENPVLYVDLEERAAFPFIPNTAPDVGHIDNLLAVPDALYLADMNRLGTLGDQHAEGVIYRIGAVGDPASPDESPAR
jgi:glucose/arabinose dehydrogenase